MQAGNQKTHAGMPNVEYTNAMRQAGTWPSSDTNDFPVPANCLVPRNALFALHCQTFIQTTCSAGGCNGICLRIRCAGICGASTAIAGSF